MTDRAAALQTFRALEQKSARVAREVRAVLGLFAEGKASPELEETYAALFYCGEAVAARLLVVERYLARLSA